MSKSSIINVGMLLGSFAIGNLGDGSGKERKTENNAVINVDRTSCRSKMRKPDRAG